MRRYKFLLLFIGLFSILLFYQNCGQISLQRPAVALPSYNVATTSGSVCPGKAPVSNQEIHFLFIVDMSLSNLGGASKSGDRYILHQENAVDWDGNRFQAVRSFIDTCGLSEGAQYSVIGFSTTTLFGSNSSHMRGCASPFTNNKNLAKQFVGDLEQIQRNDKAKNGSTGYTSPFQMGLTSYREALKCAETNISVDMAINQNPNIFYQIFFLTDGKPEERVYRVENICAAGDTACFSMFSSCSTFPNSSDAFNLCANQILASSYYPYQVTTLAQQIHLMGYNFTFQPVYYGHDDEYISAKQSLDQLAKIDNPTGETIRSDNLDTLSNELCQSLDSGSEVPYSISNIYFINLTAKEEGGVWYPDSDMDGVLDKDEQPSRLLNPRSHNALDIICQQNPSFCQIPPTCNPSAGFLLKSCDMASYNPQLSGLDTDGDGILDIVEILKGTSPNLRDDTEDDFDGDGVSNKKEIMLGTNPRVPTPFSTIKNLTDIRITTLQDESICGGHLIGYRFEIPSYPISQDVQAYSGSNSGAWDLSHGDGENVYLLYYIAAPTSSNPTLRKKVYGTIIKTKGFLSPIEIKQNNFSLIGEI